MNKSILVIADQEGAGTTALQKASEFICDSTSRITVLAFIDTSGVTDKNVSHGERLAALEEATTKYLGTRSDVSIDIVATPDIADYCVDFCRQNQIDLVIKTGHRSESLFYTPLDWQLIRKLPCPVIISVDHALSESRKMLVTLDAQSKNPAQHTLDKEVLKWAGQWAQLNGFTIYVACCIEATEPLTSTDVNKLVELEDKMRVVIEPDIRLLLDELSLFAKGILISAGEPDVVLPRLADELKTDLLVMGYTARHGLGGLIIGHTAEKVMHRLKRNLAVIRGHDER